MKNKTFAASVVATVALAWFTASQLSQAQENPVHPFEEVTITFEESEYSLTNGTLDGYSVETITYTNDVTSRSRKRLIPRRDDDDTVHSVIDYRNFTRTNWSSALPVKNTVKVPVSTLEDRLQGIADTKCGTANDASASKEYETIRTYDSSVQGYTTFAVERVTRRDPSCQDCMMEGIESYTVVEHLAPALHCRVIQSTGTIKMEDGTSRLFSQIRMIGKTAPTAEALLANEPPAQAVNVPTGDYIRSLHGFYGRTWPDTAEEWRKFDALNEAFEKQSH